mgnify:CR=1 FL=1
MKLKPFSLGQSPSDRIFRITASLSVVPNTLLCTDHGMSHTAHDTHDTHHRTTRAKKKRWEAHSRSACGAWPDWPCPLKMSKDCRTSVSGVDGSCFHLSGMPGLATTQYSSGVELESGLYVNLTFSPSAIVDVEELVGVADEGSLMMVGMRAVGVVVVGMNGGLEL